MVATLTAPRPEVPGLPAVSAPFPHRADTVEARGGTPAPKSDVQGTNP
ncbi:hypothetical protein B005_3941 [Nocardiopsis alba ATCC BAA-2165]|uniref:Uncharacterized protein n=1 Tax=Nocardiopsis alba (strain ATCC BAA-2165 / BE74) TaxID=1205910 RepID=J7LG31_NOCAA|nr:hypothetical protein B005_3941 [Nocardiopsis alba ATCC BAA-2165]